MNTGMHKGTRAIGSYGLMPKTVDDLIKRNPKYSDIANMDPITKKQHMEANPHIERDIASQLVDRLMKKTQDPMKIAYMWNHGTSLNPNNISNEVLQKDDYTNKFNKLKEKFKNNSIPLSDNTQDNSISLANNMPNIENNMKKDANYLPTNNRIASMSLEDILSDPNNPFLDEDEEDGLEKYI